jgi:hypothetical protein
VRDRRTDEECGERKTERRMTPDRECGATHATADEVPGLDRRSPHAGDAETTSAACDAASAASSVRPTARGPSRGIKR